MLPVSANPFGIGSAGARPITPSTRMGEDAAPTALDGAVATAFYPFARVSLSETRRQVEAAQQFQEQQAARREQLKDEAREAAIQKETELRGAVETEDADEVILSTDLNVPESAPAGSSQADFEAVVPTTLSDPPDAVAVAEPESQRIDVLA